MLLNHSGLEVVTSASLPLSRQATLWVHTVSYPLSGTHSQAQVCSHGHDTTLEKQFPKVLIKSTVGYQFRPPGLSV